MATNVRLNRPLFKIAMWYSTLALHFSDARRKDSQCRLVQPQSVAIFACAVSDVRWSWLPALDLRARSDGELDMSKRRGK
jgi:hypothetical protein